MVAESTSAESLRERIVDAALRCAAERPWEDVRLSDIAQAAGISLVELRRGFVGKLDILATFSARIDREVLAAIPGDLAEEPARERLFDVMMARFDALQPHRGAVRSIAHAFARNPGEALLWNMTAMRSMIWMLEAAGIESGGRMGRIRAQGLAVAFARVMKVWLEDDDPGMARTMVALDRRLREGERMLGLAEGLGRFAGLFTGFGQRRRRRYDNDYTGESEAAGSGI